MEYIIFKLFKLFLWYNSYTVVSSSSGGSSSSLTLQYPGVFCMPTKWNIFVCVVGSQACIIHLHDGGGLYIYVAISSHRPSAVYIGELTKHAITAHNSKNITSAFALAQRNSRWAIRKRSNSLRRHPLKYLEYGCPPILVYSALISLGSDRWQRP